MKHTIENPLERKEPMEQYDITGMSCAACASRVEQAVKGVEGVTSCSVNLLTNSMGVEGSTDREAVIKAVEAAGYGASVRESQPKKNSLEKAQEAEMSILKKRLRWSFGFLVVLIYFSMGHMLGNVPMPRFFHHNYIALGLVQLLLTAMVMIINQKFFVKGVKSLLHKVPNMDALVALGAGASFVYSTYALFVMTDASVKGNQEAMAALMHEFYFESAAMILFFITVGKLLEVKSKGKTTDALKSLMKLSPQSAIVERDSVEKLIPIEEVKIGDIFVVKPGEQIPVDGVVIEGMSAVNEAALTGESIPVDKKKGDLVSAATFNQSGFLKCEATRVGEDTTLSKIVEMVKEAAQTKAPIAKIDDKVSGIFVPTVIGIAIFTMVVWLLAGEGIGFALARGISVLVISCPCALGLATPVAIMVGNGVGAKHGILFKTAVSLEETGKAKIVALDKTGTITKGEPKVTNLIPFAGDEKELLHLAFLLEQKSEHPLAKAIVEEGKKQGLLAKAVTDFKALPGNGVTAKDGADTLLGGSVSFISEQMKVSKEIKERAKKLSLEGKTPLLFAKNQELKGIIAVADVIKEDSKEAIKQLQEMGLDVVMVTGDNEQTAQAIGAVVGVNRVIAGVLPQEKEAVIRTLGEQGKVIMVGDGINDAPALVRADIGIAIGAGADVAVDAADVVLMKSSLLDVPAALRLSKKTLRNIHENLFWAFIYNMLGIPLAAGVFIPLLGWKLNPMFGALAMSLSSFCVVTNALRLNGIALYKKEKTERKGEKKMMEKVMTIEGMMCAHCEGRVKKVLEALPQVTKAEVSHEHNTAKVTLNEKVDNQVLKEVVEAQDYKVISIE